MKILVCISKTPDTTAKISFTNNDSEFNPEGIQYIMNPYDEWYALVRALELKEQHGGTVTAINVGPASNDIIIRKALAIGADDAYRVDVDAKSSMTVATEIAAHAKNQGYDLIMTGKETIDYNGAEVGGMIAELLGLSFISFASNLDHDGTVATVSRDIEGGVEVLQVNGAFVLSASKGLAEQRIPNMRGIMMAKRKPLNVIAAAGGEETVQAVSFALPAEKSGVKMVEATDMDELVRLLHEEAKVI